MSAFDPKRTFERRTIRKATIKQAPATTSPKPSVRAQAVEALFLHCFAHIQTAARTISVLGSARFTAPKHRILGLAAVTPGITVGEVVRQLGITNQSLNEPLRLLISEGYVIAKIGSEDRRHKRLYATPRGRRHYVRGLAKNLAKIEDAFRTAGPEAVRGFLSVHQHLVGPGDVEHARQAARFIEQVDRERG